MMCFRNIFLSSRLAGWNYTVFYNINNLVLRRSPVRDTPSKGVPKVVIKPMRTYCSYSDSGSGTGRGGGAGGSIRESGGSLGKYGAVYEEGYFYSKQKEQLQKLKEKLRKESKEEGLREKPKQQ